MMVPRLGRAHLQWCNPEQHGLLVIAPGHPETPAESAEKREPFATVRPLDEIMGNFAPPVPRRDPGAFLVMLVAANGDVGTMTYIPLPTREMLS